MSPVAERVATMPEGATKTASTAVDYWSDGQGKPVGADINVWQAKAVRPTTWKAHVRWKPDLESGGTGGHFQMTYPNPGGGDDYIVNGRQQLQPMVDQAVRIGQEAVFGAAFLT